MPERAYISVEDISTRSVVVTAETQMMFGDLSTLVDVIHRPFLTRWFRYLCINLVWDLLEFVNGRADLDTVVYHPRYARNKARGVLTGACYSLLQV